MKDAGVHCTFTRQSVLPKKITPSCGIRFYICFHFAYSDIVTTHKYHILSGGSSFRCFKARECCHSRIFVSLNINATFKKNTAIIPHRARITYSCIIASTEKKIKIPLKSKECVFSSSLYLSRKTRGLLGALSVQERFGCRCTQRWSKVYLSILAFYLALRRLSPCPVQSPYRSFVPAMHKQMLRKQDYMRFLSFFF